MVGPLPSALALHLRAWASATGTTYDLFALEPVSSPPEDDDITLAHRADRGLPSQHDDLVMLPLESMRRLAALVPRPRLD